MNSIYYLSNALKKEHILHILSLVKKRKFIPKKSNLYFCLVTDLDREIIDYIIKNGNVLFYVGNQFEVDYIGEIVLLKHGQYLDWHVDSYHSIQVVTYLSSCKDGGEIVIKSSGKYFYFSPSIGDILIFPGNMVHKVNKVYGKCNRLSITFGFVKK